jgi:hypothetical protein
MHNENPRITGGSMSGAKKADVNALIEKIQGLREERLRREREAGPGSSAPAQPARCVRVWTGSHWP